MVGDHTRPLEVRCRLRQCAQVGALKFQFAVPTTPERALASDAYLANWRHCYGLDQPQLYPGTRCTDACTTHGPDAAIDEDQWRSGVHLLQCGCSPWRLKRHNHAGRAVLKPFYQELGYRWDEKCVQCSLVDGKRVDALCTNPMENWKPEAVDITVGCAACTSYLCPGAAARTGHATEAMETAKANKHAAAAASIGADFVPAAFTTYGGWGKVMLDKLELEYQARKKQEKADGGSGWASQRWKQDLLERMSVAIAKGNWALLDAHSRVPVAA